MHPTARRAMVVVTAVLLLALVVALIVRSSSTQDPEPSPSPTPTAAPTTASPGDEPTEEPSTPPVVASPSAPTPATPGPGTDPVTEQPPPPPAPGVVPVTVTFWGYDAASPSAQVGGYAEIVESGGTCTLTLTMGEQTASTNSTATPDAATTSCGTMVVPRTDLAPGTWSAVLSYTSTTVSGTAPAVMIEVP